MVKRHQFGELVKPTQDGDLYSLQQLTDYVLASDYDALAAELAEAKETLRKFQFPPVDWDVRLAKKDAERYRYLRTNPAMLLHLSNFAFDAAIDAAMAAQEKGEQ